MTEYKDIEDLTDVQAGDHVTILHGPGALQGTTRGVAYRDNDGQIAVGLIKLSWADVEVVEIYRPIDKVYWPSEPGLYTIASRDEDVHLHRLFRLYGDGTWEEMTTTNSEWKEHVDSGEWTLRRLRIAG